MEYRPNNLGQIEYFFLKEQMPLGYWLTINFRKILTLLLWRMKKSVKILIVFFSINFFLTGLLTNILKVLISMTI